MQVPFLFDAFLRPPGLIRFAQVIANNDTSDALQGAEGDPIRSLRGRPGSSKSHPGRMLTKL